MQTDWEITKGLYNIQRGYDALLSTRATPHDTLATAKAALDEQWQAELLPVMTDLYWHPFRNGIEEAPDDEDELRAWLKRRYNDATVVAALLLLLQRYQVRAYNLGGQTGLDFLGVDGVFDLTNPDILDELDAFAADLVRQDTDYSLIDTTIDDLVVALPQARNDSASSVLLALSAYIALRAARRTEMIERTERPRQVANGLTDVYRYNAVEYEMYDINGIGCPKICEPLHGATWPVGARPALYHLPQHTHCDCIYSPVLYDGQAVGYPPVVVNIPGLGTWLTPDDLWMGA